jgi:DNA processing protein
MRWNERTARVLLAMVASVGDSQLHDHLVSRGATEVVEALLSQRSALRRSTTYLKRLPDDPLTAVQQAMDVSQQCRAHVVIPGDEMWPDALNDLQTRCPWVIWMRGVPSSPSVKPKYSVAIVGARAATNYGTTVAYEIAADLAAEGVVVVSGGAFGIDAAAHRGALAAQGVTIAVLANGIDQVYPVGNTSLLHAVMATGVVMTELPPGMHPTRQGFLARNRLIAALGGATLVVEAAARSGSASTVTRALELGRDVMAVPGPVTSMMSVGTHELIRDGATLVTSADDVRELLNPW